MELTKIREFINKNNIQASDCEYTTQRKLEKNGKVKVLVIKGEAHVEYICPKCENHEYIKKPWKKPFSLNCSKCGETIRVQKLKYLINKERKMEKIKNK
ncbi:MAG: hypothetical protein KAU95_03890 [Candidatus Aenigmarchaeota archaeon]|nr:hypothetical protein [Candidatus Aenigmarchaeota archaeon]